MKTSHRLLETSQRLRACAYGMHSRVRLVMNIKSSEDNKILPGQYHVKQFIRSCPTLDCSAIRLFSADPRRGMKSSCCYPEELRDCHKRETRTSGEELIAMLQSNKRAISRFLCAGLFIIVGILHFTHPAPFVKIVPDYLPAHPELVYISGLCEILYGSALLWRKTRKLGRYALVALLVAVFPANINMAVNEITFGLPVWAIWLRLPLQFLLIWWVWKVGRD